MELPLFKAFNGVVAHIEDNYPVSGLFVDFGRKEQTEQLNGLFMGGGTRGVMEGEK